MAYLHFLSTGIPVGAKLEGGGTLKLKALARAADPLAGKEVYARAIAPNCHNRRGSNGQPK
jgi:thiosulfate dehydrogenase